MPLCLSRRTYYCTIISILMMRITTNVKHRWHLPCPSSSSRNKFSAPYFKMSLISCFVSDSFFSLFDTTELPPMPRWTISSDSIIFCLHTWTPTHAAILPHSPSQTAQCCCNKPRRSVQHDESALQQAVWKLTVHPSSYNILSQRLRSGFYTAN